MANSFDAELEQIISRFARDLAREITSLMLRRLGLQHPPAQTPDRSRSAKASPPPPAAAGRKPRAGAAPRTPLPAASAAPPRRRVRLPSQARTDAIERVEQTVAGSSGLSSSEIERETALSRAIVSAALKTLKDQGRLFMGGTRRFARYAKTQSIADRASLNARRAPPDESAARP
jgi:hypothetical protein